MRVYLDWNATAPLLPEARDAMMAAFDAGGNPSSVHREGRAARALVENARADVARLVDADPRDVIFTSGGTEAAALALRPAITDPPRDRLVISAIEHPAVAVGHGFAEAVSLPVGTDGIVDVAALPGALAGAARPLVSVMLANNETGILQPVAAIAAEARAAGAVTHTDAVQAVGKIPVSLAALGVDLLSFSAHKIGGPQGIGALVLRRGFALASTVQRAGGQEQGRRGGTEGVAAICGFAAAARVARERLAHDISHVARLRDRLEAGLRALDNAVQVIGDTVPRLPNTSFLRIGRKAETAVIALDLAGFAVSSGSACSSGKVGVSAVLKAMGAAAPEEGALRVSLGPATRDEDIEAFLAAFAAMRGNAGQTNTAPRLAPVENGSLASAGA